MKDDADTLIKEGFTTLDGLVVPDVDGLTSDEEAGEGKKGDEMEEDKEKEEEEEEVLALSLRFPLPIWRFLRRRTRMSLRKWRTKKGGKRRRR